VNKVRAVADTSPLIFLDRLEYVDALQELFEVFTTPVVLRELKKQPNKAGGQVDEKLFDILTPGESSHLTSKNLQLDAGETSAIALALDLSCVVILDDSSARKAARTLDLPVIGTLGVVRRLVQEGLNKRSFEEDLNLLVASGMWLSPNMIKDLLSRCS
jgi:predicted nucleic acid-binding protein